jgi:hypothetical protein
VGTIDASYRAEFDQAQHVQLSNSLEGSLMGGTVTYDGTTVPSFNDYDYYSNSVHHSVNTSVANGILGYNWNFLNWSDGVTTQSRSVVVSSDINLTASYKGIHVSNDASACSDNSQRKFIRTPNGITHCVYSSMGHVWYEFSTDNGATWQPGSNGYGGAYGPLDQGAGGKCPSIDWDPQTNHVIMVWQQASGTHYTISYKSFWPASSTSYAINSYGTLFTEGVDLYASVNANPNIAVNYNEVWVLTFERQNTDGNPAHPVSPGINIYWGIFTNGNSLDVSIHQSYMPTLISGTNSSSVNATIYGNKTIAGETDGNSYLFPLAWQQGPGIHSTQIKYAQLAIYYNPVETPPNNYDLYPQYSPTQLSYSNTPDNYHPSIIGIPGSGGPTFAVCWLLDFTGYGNPATMRVAYLNGGSSTLYYYGYDPQSCSINLSDDNSSSYFVWSQIQNNAWSNQVVSSANLGYIGTLGSTGSDVQLANGLGKGNMYATSYYTSAAPYYFSAPVSLNSVNGLQKTTPVQVSNSRGVMLGNDKAKLYYSLGGLTVDGNNIPFVSIPDSFKSKNLNDVNALFQTQPFSVQSNSKVVFGEWMAMADSGTLSTVLGDSCYVSFKAELVDASTGSVLGTLKQLKLGSKTLSKYSQAGYNLNTSGISSGELLRIRITASTNIKNPTATPVDDYTTHNITTGMSATQSLALQGLNAATDYALGQNYPNPFNPATTISYQVPKDGRVTIKIFDAIGREVTTLVDEFKPSGRYSVKFDASHLSSGIYFYSIRSADYTAVKKMSLIK